MVDRRQIAQKLGIPLGRIALEHDYSGVGLDLNSDHPPGSTVAVGGSGQCLFNSLSFLLYGHEAYAMSLRSLVCAFMSSPVNWKRVEVWVGKNVYVNGAAYVQATRMMHPTAWATEVELLAWAALSKRDVCVWDEHLKRWIRHASAPEIAGVYSTAAWYLQLNAGHFEPVLGVKQDENN